MNYYTAKVFARHCLVDIRINDVPLFQRSVDADFYAEIPINYLIEFSGEQDLSTQLHPELEQISLHPCAMCSVVIWRYEERDSKISPMEQVCSSSISMGENEKFFSLKKDAQIFQANVSHHIIRWSNCEIIRDRRNLALEVVAFYREVGHLLANKQYSKYMEHVRDREIKVCAALSLGEKEVDKRNQILFEHLDNDFVLQPLTGNENVCFYANRRLVTLLDNDMKSALRFINNETDEILVVEFLLGIKKGESRFCII